MTVEWLLLSFTARFAQARANTHTPDSHRRSESRRRLQCLPLRTGRRAGSPPPAPARPSPAQVRAFIPLNIHSGAAPPLLHAVCQRGWIFWPARPGDGGSPFHSIHPLGFLWNRPQRHQHVPGDTGTYQARSGAAPRNRARRGRSMRDLLFVWHANCLCESCGSCGHKNGPPRRV
jgi:hypothetical protein